MSELDATPQTRPAAAANPGEPLRQEYAAWQALLEAQPGLTQRFIEAQGGLLAEALAQREPSTQIRFMLPAAVRLTPAGPEQVVPAEFREQMAGGLIDRLTRANLGPVLRQRLAELEQSPNQAVAVSAGLLRHAAVRHMVGSLLPAGRSVRYARADDDEIASLPTGDAQPASALTAPEDAVAEGEAAGAAEGSRGELLVPFVPAARRFYLPQWVAFDDEGRLLVSTAAEAEARVGSMQRFLAILHAAIALAPYIVADEAYQQKRYGMLGQLVNQGRALARYQAGQIVATVRRRAAAQDLNRGLALSLPYFDDQELSLRTHYFEVIPAGRVMFVPAFVVRAAQAERAKVGQDTRLSHSTRRHLLETLQLLEAAFETQGGAGR